MSFLHATSPATGAAPASPFLIHYDGAADTRIELSRVTFANWVDKTCNLLDTLGVEPADAVRVELVETDPGHWVTAVWVAAVWQRACTVTTDESVPVALVVAGPHAKAAGVDTVACSLHPLGLALPKVPAGCIDYAEVFSEPDVHDPQPFEPGDLAWDPDVTFADLEALPARADRELFVDPSPGFDTVAEILVAPLLGGGSSVVITGGDEAFVARVREQELPKP